ncbi:hypothetical protein [Clostridium prolinivorans]|jgi:hypothetical protein|uniref:hypothetical protein n=1 Tax=Clostridium prolinivorans TaxID=2769420 RepID=UPI000FDC748D|nr:hypothetical protein [Clostridium prolinivorans]
MKKYKLCLLLPLVILFFSFDIVSAKSLISNEDNNPLILEIEEKRKLIKKQFEINKNLETKVEKKSKQAEDLLVKVPENAVIPQDILNQQIDERMDVIMNHLYKIGEQERLVWENINAANDNINAKNYSEGIKGLDKTLTALEKKYKYLVEFDADLDDLLSFLSTIDEK